uniref:SCP domain-containing protein n=1 Tax=Mesocestoides corti TaxID=53468 RepID=A0A5K3FK19_MESCO
MREHVRPPASSMQMISCSNDLEMLSEEWISHCVDELPDEEVDTKYVVTGMFLTVQSADKFNFISKLQTYGSEPKEYHYANNTCASLCADYKMMVWSKTTEVGCAVQLCSSSLLPYIRSYLVACLYKPGIPRVTERPYKTGRSCSKCPEGFECYRKQC